MSTVATTGVKKLATASKQNSISELRKKYEIETTVAGHDGFKSPAKQLSRMEKKSKVQQIALMFNTRFPQTEANETDIKAKCSTWGSGGAKKQTKACIKKFRTMAEICNGKDVKMEAKVQAKSTFFESEDNFDKLTVRDKAQLYTQFINEMAVKNPKFSKHVELIEAKVKTEANIGEVVHEKQAPVKYLLEELEAKYGISALALKKRTGTQCMKSLEFEDMHRNKRTPDLKPTNSERRARSMPRSKKDRELISMETNGHKRCNNEMNISLPIEAYAPPKKIRRTKNEMFAPKIFFCNQKLQELFFTWLNENEKRSAQNAKEVDQDQRNRSKSALDQLLEETIENLGIGDFEDVAPKTCKEKHKKKPAPPAPVENVNQTKSPNAGTPNLILKTRIPDDEVNSADMSTKYFDKPEESESGLSTLSKITSDESHADCSCEQENVPARKKKLRRIIACKKDNPMEEHLCIKSTDSDSDFYVRNKIETTSEASSEEVDKSPRYNENSSADDRSDQSPIQKQNSKHLRLENAKSPLTDQGFETASANGMYSPVRVAKNGKILLPLFIKLDSGLQSDSQVIEIPFCVSTPHKEKHRRRSTYDTESRRSLLDMQVIRENQPLENHERTSSTPTPDGVCNDLIGLNLNKTSQFWIKCGELTVSLDVFHNNTERLRLLYEILVQKTCDVQDLHFGIDDKRFSVKSNYGYENVSKLLPASKDCSYFWFSTGDLAIPFMGDHIASEKIERIFDFIKVAVLEIGSLSFGVDAIEFSNVSEFRHQSSKFSLSSSYSMLVGLQSGSSNGLEGRSKFAWPHTKSVRVSNSDQFDFEGEYFEDNDSYRLSLSPFHMNNCDLSNPDCEELSSPRFSEVIMNRESFGAEYEKEPLDRLFDEKIKTHPGPEVLNALITQKNRLKLAREKLAISTQYPKSNSTCALDKFKENSPYLQKLRSVVADIIKKGRTTGFKQCSVQQLKNYLFLLKRYADICLQNCTNHMDKVMDVLTDQNSKVV